MGFQITGYVTVTDRYEEQQTFSGDDFGFEDGNGTHEDDDGAIAHAGIWKAFGMNDAAVIVSVVAYLGGQVSFDVSSENCAIVDDQLDFDFSVAQVDER